MGRENIDNWSVRKCAKACTKCEKEFADKEVLFSNLSFDAGEYQRNDFCKACWDKDNPGLSSWKTIFISRLMDRISAGAISVKSTI